MLAGARAGWWEDGTGWKGARNGRVELLTEHKQREEEYEAGQRICPGDEGGSGCRWLIFELLADLLDSPSPNQVDKVKKEESRPDRNANELRDLDLRAAPRCKLRSHQDVEHVHHGKHRQAQYRVELRHVFGTVDP